VVATPSSTPPIFSETEELHHLRIELQLLKDQVQDVACVCNTVARGDLSQKITVPIQGVVMVRLKDVINTMVDKLGQFAREVTRVSQEVGTEGWALILLVPLSVFPALLIFSFRSGNLVVKRSSSMSKEHGEKSPASSTNSRQT
jgi:osomolarity two-component system sensor histidine kinase NIK1